MINDKCTKKLSRRTNVLPDMNKKLITRYIGSSTRTAKGHMVRVQHHIYSTQSKQPAILETCQEVENMVPIQQMYSAIQNKMFFSAILRNEEKNTIYGDPTGRFPIELHIGMN
jgi:hypothetical protein